jgi:hypothetical protein
MLESYKQAAKVITGYGEHKTKSWFNVLLKLKKLTLEGQTFI